MLIKVERPFQKSAQPISNQIHGRMIPETFITMQVRQQYIGDAGGGKE